MTIILAIGLAACIAIAVAAMLAVAAEWAP